MYYDLFHLASRLIDKNTHFVMVTVIEASGSTPAKTSFRMIVESDGTLHGTVGGGALESEAITTAKSLIGQNISITKTFSLEKDLNMACGGQITMFFESFAASVLHIFGAGHVCQALIPVMMGAGFAVKVYDDREGFDFVSEKFGCQFTKDDMAKQAALISDGPGVFALVTTYNHIQDEAVGRELITKNLAFLGIIGSRRKAEKYRNNFIEAGFDPEKVNGIFCPVGLPVGGTTPGEIAVSIASQMLSVKYGRTLS